VIVEASEEDIIYRKWALLTPAQAKGDDDGGFYTAAFHDSPAEHVPADWLICS
jgi:hypothetical protein